MGRFGISAAAAFSIFLAFDAPTRAEVTEGSTDVPPASGQPMGRVAVRRGVQAPGGLFTARLLLLVNASKDNFGKPTSFCSTESPTTFRSVFATPGPWAGNRVPASGCA